MAIHQLIKSDNLLLTIPLSNVSEEADRKQIKEDLFETMDNFKGIGLSGNQVGIMERVFVMYSNFTKREKIVCFNPKITLASETEEFMDEGCLSFDRAKKRATKQRKKIINMSLSRGGLDSWLPSDAW